MLFLALIFTNSLFAEIRLPKLVSDNMVIQRDAEVKIWGWADVNEKIRVKFNKKNYSAVTNKDGIWSIMLSPSKPGGPYTMDIKGEDNSITLQNILIGDVWMCSGQSNMVHYLDLHKDRYKDEIANANYPEIRQFLVPTHPQLYGPSEDIPEGSWKEANPENVLRFSVIAYFFAKKLYDEYQIPIGLINSSVGGTPIEAWTSEEGLKNFKDLVNTIEQNKDTAYVNRVNREAQLKRQQNAKTDIEDKGLTGSMKWYDPEFQPKNWNQMNIPGYWEDQGIRDLNGSVWFRKEVEVPETMTGKPVRIHMGRIIDADHIYINGQLVGNKTYQYPQRIYEFDEGVLKEGKNIITIQVQNYGGKGGFVPDKPYYLSAGSDTIDLKGYWHYKVGEVYTPQPWIPGISAQNSPTALYNGMIAPFVDFPIKGIIWYQGESNAGHPETYGALMEAIILDWRNKWDNPNLPFIYAQLPNFMDVNYSPKESNWAEMREAQRKALKVPNTAMAVSLNLGEWNDIHPGNKKPIGDRMALAAMKLAYGDENIVYSGPMYSSFQMDGNEVSLTFDHVGGGLVSNDGEELRWFAIAGEDKEFVWAESRIEGNKVIVWNDDIEYPAYVRYAWADNPDKANFFNKEGLPASPFEITLFDENALWQGKKAAVVITYDDALDVHLDHAIPVLDSLGFKGSFYLSAASPGSVNRIEDWKNAARNGHELGNHTLYHPCDGSKPGRSWVTPENDLSTYSTQQIVREIETTNVFLKMIDGKSERTYAYTCGDMTTSDGSFVDAIKDKFVSLRGVSSQLNYIESMDYTNLNCYGIDNSNADQLVSLAEKAREENALLVILFHGVGGGHNLNVDLDKHNAFLEYLKENQQDFWVTTLIVASKHAKEVLEKNK
mgnify:CR=1 FL=1